MEQTCHLHSIKAQTAQEWVTRCRGSRSRDFHPRSRCGSGVDVLNGPEHEDVLDECGKSLPELKAFVPHTKLQGTRPTPGRGYPPGVRSPPRGRAPEAGFLHPQSWCWSVDEEFPACPYALIVRCVRRLLARMVLTVVMFVTELQLRERCNQFFSDGVRRSFRNI